MVPAAAVEFKQFPPVWVDACEFEVVLVDILEWQCLETYRGNLWPDDVHEIFLYAIVPDAFRRGKHDHGLCLAVMP